MMKKFLEMPVKKFIAEYPEAGRVLEEYNIGCAPCSVGTCLLKDIVGIHNLSEEDEKSLFEKLAGVIYPGKKVSLAAVERKAKMRPAGKISYSPPIKKLIDEHIEIKKLIAAIPALIAGLDVGLEAGRKAVLDCVYFIRNYADKYHHAKEEEILFKYFDEGLDILKVMREDHETGRSHVRAVVDAVEKKDKKAIAEHLTAYAELLTGHIKKEDEILYPWMDRNLSVAKVGELFSKFNEVDEKYDREVVSRCKSIVEKLEKQKRFLVKIDKKRF